LAAVFKKGVSNVAHILILLAFSVLLIRDLSVRMSVVFGFAATTRPSEPTLAKGRIN